MEAKNIALSAEDVAKLLEDPSTGTRMEVVRKLTTQYALNLKYGEEYFTPEEVKLAEQIFRLLLKNAEMQIRKLLAEQLKDIPSIPKDIILGLANDTEPVAVPVLQFSEVLTDSDLITIIKTTNEVAKHLAVSSRNALSPNVSEALVDTENGSVVSTLLDNPGAKVSTTGFSKIIDLFSSDESVVGSLLKRENQLNDMLMAKLSGKLPVHVLEKLTATLSEQIKVRLTQAKVPLDEIEKALKKSADVATLKFAGVASSDDELKHFIDILDKARESAHELYDRNAEWKTMLEKLETSGRLTPFSALCLGHLSLFEVSVARLAKVPVANTKKLLKDTTGEGFRALYDKAGLPATMFDATLLMVEVLREMEDHGNPRPSPALFSNRLIESILHRAEEAHVPNISYFVTMIKHHSRLAG